jgi:hypothetical protein
MDFQRPYRRSPNRFSSSSVRVGLGFGFNLTSVTPGSLQSNVEYFIHCFRISSSAELALRIFRRQRRQKDDIREDQLSFSRYVRGAHTRPSNPSVSYAWPSSRWSRSVYLKADIAARYFGKYWGHSSWGGSFFCNAYARWECVLDPLSSVRRIVEDEQRFHAGLLIVLFRA